MKTTRFLGLLCVSLAMFALPAAAQTPDGVTPANEGICDPLADATPGLQGLCIAMCEAQDCEAELNPDTGEVTFDPSCRPSSEQLLGNYNKIADPVSDPRMPCVKIACPCWTEAELDNIGGRPGSDRCSLGDSAAGLWGASTDGGGGELAYVLDDRVSGLMCLSIQRNPATNRDPYRDQPVNADEYTVCRESVIDEIKSRDLTPTCF